MDLFLEIIYLLKQDHIFLHVLGILLLVLILVGGNLGAAILDHAFQVLSLLRLVALALLVVDLLMQHVLFVQLHNLLLELLVIRDVLHDLETVIFELFGLRFLFLQRRRQLAALNCKTALAHSEVLGDQSQVLVDPFEILDLLVHAVSVLVKFIDFFVAWSHGVLELFDLVVKHKFEFFKLLGLFSEGVDVRLLFFNALFTLLQFFLLLNNLSLEVLSLSDQLLQ